MDPVGFGEGQNFDTLVIFEIAKHRLEEKMTDVSFNMGLGQMNDCPCTIQLAQFHKQFLPNCLVTTKKYVNHVFFEWHVLTVRGSVFLA